MKNINQIGNQAIFQLIIKKQRMGLQIGYLQKMMFFHINQQLLKLLKSLVDKILNNLKENVQQLFNKLNTNNSMILN